MRPTSKVDVTYVGKFHVSTIVDDRGSYESRLFRTERVSYQGEDIPQILKDAIESTTWADIVSDVAFKAYDSEGVETFGHKDATAVHATLVKMLEDFNSGTLA